MPYLERLLRCQDEELHDQIAHCLWDRVSNARIVAIPCTTIASSILLVCSVQCNGECTYWGVTPTKAL